MGVDGSGGEGIVYVEMLEFRVGVELERIEFYCNRFLALQEKSMKPGPGNGVPYKYIKSIKGGRNMGNVTGGLQHPHTHIFILEFHTPDEKTYYLEQDPARRDFEKSIEDMLRDRLVVDFVPGEWGTPRMGERGGSVL
ncbi:hypothetical protein HYFRA_00006513 [Hymenoscyphus fraxineus]|uniref:Stress-response A/B barrel domain-containing protein n=1 Tax=Hymenoscyphus fraxineus TaxID=746836 RepID=A0A9N9KNI4_9HELO|nr:hypothetical protein HYFRA_00006513 [Hymenoscyphus fraxineus]